jgi:hypothetical protein
MAVAVVTTAFGKGASTQLNEFGMRARDLRSPIAGNIKVANKQAYYTGLGFEMSKGFIDINAIPVAMEKLRLLATILYGTPEATQVGAAIVLLDQGQGQAALIVLERAQDSYEARITPEQKWFYNVGKTYFQAVVYWALDKKLQSIQKMIEVGQLVKTAPVGTPANLLNALAKIGETGSQALLKKTDFTKAEVAEIEAQWNALENAMKA